MTSSCSSIFFLITKKIAALFLFVIMSTNGWVMYVIIVSITSMISVPGVVTIYRKYRMYKSETSFSYENMRHKMSHFADNYNEVFNDNDYDKIKQDFIKETYLYLVKKPKYRIAISKLRCSSHTLAIEKGRHTKPKTDLSGSLCLFFLGLIRWRMKTILSPNAVSIMMKETDCSEKWSL